MQTKLLFVATKLHLISWNKHILFLSSGLNLHAHFLFHVKGLLQFPTTLNKQYECEPGVCHSAYWMGTCKTLHICYIFLLSQPRHTDLHLSHYGMVVIIPVFQELLVLLSVIVVYVFFFFLVSPQCDWGRCRQRHQSFYTRHWHVCGWVGHLAAVSQSGPKEATWGHGPVQRWLRSGGTSEFIFFFNCFSTLPLSYTRFVCLLDSFQLPLV